MQLKQRGYYANLKQLVETMYEQNNNTKVTLVVHSMGGPVSLYFLANMVNQQWKDQYIHSYVTLAGAWNGANSGLGKWEKRNLESENLEICCVNNS